MRRFLDARAERAAGRATAKRPEGLARLASAANATTESGGEAETQAGIRWYYGMGASGVACEVRAGVSQRSAAMTGIGDCNPHAEGVGCWHLLGELYYRSRENFVGESGSKPNLGRLIVPDAVSEMLAGMRLGGIDPSILRELSGVYKPFVKAFKELISNAFDADADAVIVEFSDDFSAVTVTDDGRGMTPFEFRNDFTRIGGGSRRWEGDRTAKGRLRIGSKGIGFLALARYCCRLEIESSAERSFVCEVSVPETPATIDLRSHLGVPVSQNLLNERVKVGVRRKGGRTLRERRDYCLDRRKNKVVIGRKVGPVIVRIRFDCRDLSFRSILDFERLLELADKADLDKVDDFASIVVIPRSRECAVGTRITAAGIKTFVRRELRSDRRKGYVRNVESLGGLERFVWQLSRCTPVPYEVPANSGAGPTFRIT